MGKDKLWIKLFQSHLQQRNDHELFPHFQIYTVPLPSLFFTGLLPQVRNDQLCDARGPASTLHCQRMSKLHHGRFRFRHVQTANEICKHTYTCTQTNSLRFSFKWCIVCFLIWCRSYGTQTTKSPWGFMQLFKWYLKNGAFVWTNTN